MTRQLSKALQEYLDWIKNQTGRDIRIQCVRELGIPGMSFAFVHHPTDIQIQYVEPYRFSDKQFEQSVAHEATHGLLVYGLGYTSLERTKKASTEYENRSISILLTMVDDVVVNKIIADRGFAPYGENYLEMVEQETEAAQKDQKDFYADVSSDDRVQKRFRLYRCFTAKAYLKFYVLDPPVREKLETFVKVFEQIQPEDADEVAKIMEVFERHDVFTAEGHREILLAVLDLWGLSEWARPSLG